MKRLLPLMLVVGLLGCGRPNTLEGDWTFIGTQGDTVAANFSGGKLVFTLVGERYTLITHGTYTSDKPESVTITLSQYVLENSQLTPKEEAYFQNLPSSRTEYTVEWKSSDEFILSQVAAPGQIRVRPPMVYRRK